MMTPRAGERIEDWTLDCLLGEGGFGSTWRALNTHGEIAAVKLLSAVPGDELRALSRLRHPCVPTVYSAGSHPRPFIAMELIEGHPISRWVQAGPAPHSHAAQLLLLLSDALATVHRNGLIHGDVTPDNIILESISEGKVALIDFGLCTRGTGGTLRYVAPEILDGGTSSPRSDVYGLGLVIWAVLHGADAWSSMDLSRSLIERRTAAPTPTEGPEWLQILLQRMLHPEAATRPTASEIVDRLEERGFQLPQPPTNTLIERTHSVNISDPDVQRRLNVWLVQGGTLVVTGRAGCGRSHLLLQAQRELSANGMPWVRLECDPNGWSAAEKALRSSSLPNPIPPLPTCDDPQERAEALAAALEERSPDTLHVLVDDLEMLTDAARRVLDALVDRGHAAVLIAAHEPPSAWCHNPIVLGPWTPERLHAWMEAVLGPVSANDDIAGRLHDASGGVPKEAAKMLLALVASGGLLRRHQQWVCDRTTWDATLRTLPADVVLPAIDDSQREFLEWICFAQHALTAEDLQCLTDTDGNTLRDTLSSLVRCHLVRAEDGGLQPMGPTIRRATQDECDAPRARHHQLALHLIAIERDDHALAAHLVGAEDASLIEQHGARALEQVGQYDRHDAASAALEMWRIAPCASNAAATVHALIGGGRIPEAIGIGESVIAEHEDKTSPEVWCAYAKACLELPERTDDALRAMEAARDGQPEPRPIEHLLVEAKAHFKHEDSERAIQTARQAPSPPQDDRSLGYWLALRGVEAQALESCGRIQDAIERLMAVPSGLGAGLAARSSLDSTMGRLLWRSGQQREAAVWWERAVAGEGLSALNKARLLNNAACALYQVGDRAGAVQRWEDTYARFDRMRATLDMVRVAINLCVGYRELDRPSRARDYGRWAIEGAAELNEAELQTVATGNLGDALRDAGDSDAARQLYETAWGLACASELPLDKAEGARRLLALALDGSWPDVETYIARAKTCAGDASDPLESAKLSALLARHSAAVGEADQAESHASEATDVLTQEGDAGALAVVRLSLARAWHSLGQPARARSELERSRAWAIEHDHPLLQRQADELAQELPDETLDDGRLDLLLQLATEVSRERDLSRLLDQIASAALQLIRGDHAFVMLCDKGEPEVVAMASEHGRDGTARPSMSVVRRALRQRREVIVADVAERADLRSRESVVAMAVRSVLCVPLLDDDQIVGAVYVDQTQGSVAELQQATKFMRALASHAAVAVSNARALATAKRRAEWVSEAAHDIRGPIGTVVSMLGSVQDLEAEREELRALAVHAMDVAESVLRDGSIERRPVDVSAVVERSCASLERDVAGHGARLVWSTAPDLFVMGVSLDLQRCLSNLVRNAARFSPKGGVVRVQLSTRGRAVVLTVQDEGPGIPPAILPTLFQRGVTGGGAQSQTGLGLAIVADRVRGLGGQIEASNAPGGGGVFTVQLPRCESPQARPVGAV